MGINAVRYDDARRLLKSRPGIFTHELPAFYLLYYLIAGRHWQRMAAKGCDWRRPPIVRAAAFPATVAVAADAVSPGRSANEHILRIGPSAERTDGSSLRRMVSEFSRSFVFGNVDCIVHRDFRVGKFVLQGNSRRERRRHLIPGSEPHDWLIQTTHVGWCFAADLLIFCVEPLVGDVSELEFGWIVDRLLWCLRILADLNLTIETPEAAQALVRRARQTSPLLSSDRRSAAGRPPVLSNLLICLWIRAVIVATGKDNDEV
jgi:hypothetical protein